MKDYTIKVKSLVSKHPKKIQGTLVGFILLSTIAAVGIPKAMAGSPSQSAPATPNNGTQAQEQTLTETNQSTLDKNQPAPQLTYSLERQNLIQKLNFTNNPNQIGYVYLLGANGQVIANYTIKGKVSSLNSLLTTPDQLRCSEGSGSGEYSCVAAVSPDLDGSYGNNPDGIFFFTTSNAYVEWSGPYLYASQPLNITTPVTLTETAK